MKVKNYSSVDDILNDILLLRQNVNSLCRLNKKYKISISTSLIKEEENIIYKPEFRKIYDVMDKLLQLQYNFFNIKMNLFNDLVKRRKYKQCEEILNKIDNKVRNELSETKSYITDTLKNIYYNSFKMLRKTLKSIIKHKHKSSFYLKPIDETSHYLLYLAHYKNLYANDNYHIFDLYIIVGEKYINGKFNCYIVSCGFDKERNLIETSNIEKTLTELLNKFNLSNLNGKA